MASRSCQARPPQPKASPTAPQVPKVGAPLFRITPIVAAPSFGVGTKSLEWKSKLSNGSWFKLLRGSRHGERQCGLVSEHDSRQNHTRLREPNCPQQKEAQPVVRLLGLP